MAFEVPERAGAGVFACKGKPYRVKIRRGPGLEVRPEAEQLDGRVYIFREGWTMEDSDPYPGEEALIPNDFDWPADAPVWIASGDLEKERFDIPTGRALVMWEGEGVEEVPTRNLLALRDQLEQEIERRLPEADTSLDRRDARMKAESLENAAEKLGRFRGLEHSIQPDELDDMARELRRQFKETGDGNR